MTQLREQQRSAVVCDPNPLTAERRGVHRPFAVVCELACKFS